MPRGRSSSPTPRDSRNGRSFSPEHKRRKHDRSRSNSPGRRPRDDTHEHRRPHSHERRRTERSHSRGRDRSRERHRSHRDRSLSDSSGHSSLERDKHKRKRRTSSERRERKERKARKKEKRERKEKVYLHWLHVLVLMMNYRRRRRKQAYHIGENMALSLNWSMYFPSRSPHLTSMHVVCSQKVPNSTLGWWKSARSTRRLSPRTRARNSLRALSRISTQVSVLSSSSSLYLMFLFSATLPHEKYYDMAAHERRMSAMRSGEYLPPANDSYDPDADLKAIASAHKKKGKEPETYMTKEQLMDLRRVQNERVQVSCFHPFLLSLT